MKKPNSKVIKTFICHQRPERTFKLFGHYLPVCSRCTGIYTGAAFYFIIAYFFNIQYTLLLILFALFMITPTILDGTTQYLGLRESNNKIRVTTGIIGGIGTAIIVKTIKWTLLQELNII